MMPGVQDQPREHIKMPISKIRRKEEGRLGGGEKVLVIHIGEYTY